jgi:hypothetical protein
MIRRGDLGQPVTRESLVAEWGGGAAGRKALARRMARIKPDAKLPKKGSKARTRYETAMRGLQRSERGINQRTGLPKQFRPNAKAQASIERIVKRERKRREPAEAARGEAAGGRMTASARLTFYPFGHRKHESRLRDFEFSITPAEWRAIMRDERRGRDGALVKAMLRSKNIPENAGAAVTNIRWDFTAN